MSRRLPRSVYVRRWLLLLAGGLLVAWLVVQFWPTGAGDGARPSGTSTVTALPSASPTPTVKPTPKPTPTAPATPAEGTTTTVSLPSGTKACDSSDVAMVPSVGSPQPAQQPVLVDVAVITTAKKPCVFTPKAFDPLVAISHDGDTVWDSSVCKKAVVARPVQLVPGWATTVRVPWIPRTSGTVCKGDEAWLAPGAYTLRVGTLGGEPGRADFALSDPPPPPQPPPSPSPTPAPGPSSATLPAPVPSPAPSTKPAG